jgi:hypothetical protein
MTELSFPHGAEGAAAAGTTTPFGAFKPVGHVMVGVPTQPQADALAGALRDAGWAGAAVRPFAPQESLAEWQALVDNAGLLAGFGHEITLLRRYVELTHAGYRWLLVQADDDAHAVAAAAVARAGGATLAVHYRSLTSEDLIP